jgi:ribosomal protein S18 acetylase RimI-like enzyme
MRFATRITKRPYSKGVTYFKRYRMEVDLRGRRIAVRLPAGYLALPWDTTLLAAHGATKYECFRAEIDARLFPCLSEREGCDQLMRELVAKESFLPEATWLLEFCAAGLARREYCGTIQGMRLDAGHGGIQNVGVTRFHRGRGLGEQLLLLALSGFQQVGIRKVALEVTAENTSATRLYERCGFRRIKTLYKAIEVVWA